MLSVTKQIMTTSPSQIFQNGIKETIDTYMAHGPRSSKKTDRLNQTIIDIITRVLDDKGCREKYEIRCECNVKSLNQSGKKSCDIVVFKDSVPYIVLPLKFIMSSYQKNANNYWENLTGEVTHLMWANEDIGLKIVPINIIADKIPMLDNNGVIKRWENITHDNSFAVYQSLVTRHLAYQVFNAVLHVDYTCNIGEKYDCVPIIKSISENVSLYDVLCELL